MKGRKGIYKHTEQWKREARQRMLGENNPFWGKTHAAESLTNVKLFRKGQASPRKGMKSNPDVVEKIALKLRGRKQRPELVRKRLARRALSSLEKKMVEIITKNNLPYRFVGNGQFFIENKNPDFVNVNGDKIALETYYRRHKQLFRGSVENWQMERQEIFSKYGWEIVFFDETQVCESIVLERLGGPKKPGVIDGKTISEAWNVA
jgi:hypothetical protein